MDANLVVTQVTAGAGCAYLLQLLQKWERLPWITQHSTAINHAIRVVMSGAAVLGISSAWSPSTGGGHTLTIVIPPAMVIVHGLWTWFGQFAITHGFGSLLQAGNGGGGQPAIPAPVPAPGPPAPPAPVPNP